MASSGLRLSSSARVAPSAPAIGQLSVVGLTADGRSVLSFSLVTSTGVFPDNYLPAFEGRLPREVYQDIVSRLNAAVRSYKSSPLRSALNVACILCTGGLAAPLWVLPYTYRRHSRAEAALAAALADLNTRHGPRHALNLRRNPEGELALAGKGVRAVQIDLELVCGDVL